MIPFEKDRRFAGWWGLILILTLLGFGWRGVHRPLEAPPEAATLANTPILAVSEPTVAASPASIDHGEDLVAWQERLARWAKASPAEARVWALSSEENRLWLPFLAAQQATVDLPALCDWLFLHLPPAEAQSLLVLALTEVARIHPSDTLNYLVRLEDSPEKRDLVERIAAQWAEQSMEQSLAWALTQVDSSQRAAAVVGALSPSSLSAPELALKVAKAHLTGTYEFDRFAFTVLQHWIHRDPEHALGWALTALDRPLAAQALDQFLPLWLEENPDEALRWVASLDDPELRRKAFSTIGAGPSSS